MTTNLMKQIDELIELERERTFDKSTVNWWIEQILKHVKALDPHWLCPCGELNISAGDSTCLEIEYVEEDFENREEDDDNDVDDWTQRIDYCGCQCRRSKVYGTIKNELHLAYNIVEHSEKRRRKRNYDDINKAIDYFIKQLKQLGKIK